MIFRMCGCFYRTWALVLVGESFRANLISRFGAIRCLGSLCVEFGWVHLEVLGYSDPQVVASQYRLPLKEL